MTFVEPTHQPFLRRLAAEVSRSEWEDWQWHIKHSIGDITTFEHLSGIAFGQEEKRRLEETVARYPLAITPYYLTLINPGDFRNDPIFKQSFPDSAEMVTAPCELSDPLEEEKYSPVSTIVHRYPDRVLFYITNTCSMYCRHCSRKRKVGDRRANPSRDDLLEGIRYIKETARVRDVVISGGDPLMCSDDRLEWLLRQLRAIDHVEVIRLHSRMPVVLPYRITDALVQTLQKYHPLWLNTQFNHPLEFTAAAAAALKKLADAGIPLGNQSVLLAGVNDSAETMKRLGHLLVQNRVRPYYLFHCDLAQGLSHFRTSIERGLEIMECLIGHTSGFSVPTYVLDAAGGGGKIPLLPHYLISHSEHRLVIKNHEGTIKRYGRAGSICP
jgi:lysine 2,3-aminomutase